MFHCFPPSKALPCVNLQILCVSILAAASSTGMAEESDPANLVEPPGWFKKLDQDGNGRLDAGEAGRFLKAMDADGDQQVTLAEAVAYVKRRQVAAQRKGKRPSGRQMLLKAADFDDREKAGKGLWVVSIGHSCVIPAIEPCIAVSRLAGNPDHLHLMQFSGGAGGAARAQWSYDDQRQQAKLALATGKIDVMTFGHLVTWNGKSVGCDVEDYERWIGLALKHNRNSRFFIQDLWPWLYTAGEQKGTERELDDYVAAMRVSSESINQVVESLDQKFPGRVHILPAGIALTELVRRFHRHELPGVDAVLVGPVQKKQGKKVGLYRDKIHPTQVVAALQGYIYYACLYGKNPRHLASGIYPDEELDKVLREVAWATVKHHPRSGVVSK